MTSPEGTARALEEFLRVWGDLVPPTLKGALPGLPGVLQEAIGHLDGIQERPTFADNSENPALAAALRLANLIDESDSAEAQDLADWVKKIQRRPKPVFQMDYIAEALRDGKIPELRFERRFADYRDITHVTYLSDAIVLREGVCHCKCHMDGATIIMHDTPCCQPIKPFTYPAQFQENKDNE